MAKLTTKSRDQTKKLRRQLTAVNKELYFHVVYSDVLGPMQVRSASGHYYGITFTEMTSLKKKSDALTAFKMLNAEVQASGFKIRMLKSDNGGEYKSEAFKEYCLAEKIVQRFTSPHTPSSNAISERFNRVLGEKCRAMLYGANLPMSLWAECMKTATYIANRLISSTHRTKTAYELLYGVKPDVSNLRAFGCVAYYYNFDVDRRKLDNRALKGVLVGYDLESASYLIYSPEKHSIRKSGHVVFNEHQLYYNKPPKEIQKSFDDEDNEGVEHTQLKQPVALSTNNSRVSTAQSATSTRKSNRARRAPDRLAFTANEYAYSVEELLDNSDGDGDISDLDETPVKFSDLKHRSDQQY